MILQVIEKALEVGADSNQFPENWIFHSREKKPGKAFVDGLLPDLSWRFHRSCDICFYFEYLIPLNHGFCHFRL